MSSFSAVGLLLSPLYGVSVVPTSQWPYHLRRMITESSAFDRMPVVESNASLRTSRCTPLAGAMLKVCAPASCWISAAHTPAAFTTTRAETSNDPRPSTSSTVTPVARPSGAVRTPVTLAYVITCAPYDAAVRATARVWRGGGEGGGGAGGGRPDARC